MVTGLGTAVGMLDGTNIIGEVDGRGVAIGRLDVFALLIGGTEIGVPHLQFCYLTGDIHTAGDDLFGRLLVGLIDRTRLTGIHHLPAVLVFVGLYIAIGQYLHLVCTNLICPAVLQEDGLLHQVFDDT